MGEEGIKHHRSKKYIMKSTNSDYQGNVLLFLNTWFHFSCYNFSLLFSQLIDQKQSTDQLYHIFLAQPHRKTDTLCRQKSIATHQLPIYCQCAIHILNISCVVLQGIHNSTSLFSYEFFLVTCTKARVYPNNADHLLLLFAWLFVVHLFFFLQTVFLFRKLQHTGNNCDWWLQAHGKVLIEGALDLLLLCPLSSSIDQILLIVENPKY